MPKHVGYSLGLKIQTTEVTRTEVDAPWRLIRYRLTKRKEVAELQPDHGIQIVHHGTLATFKGSASTSPS
jgi:hypothetical protein